MSQKYQITVTEEQLGMLIAATELLARVGMGQLKDVAQYTPIANGDVPSVEEFHRLGDAIQQIEPLATGLDRNAYPGIGSRRVPKVANRAWDMYQVLRHRLSWDKAGNPPKRDFSTMMGVSYDEPMNVAGEPLPIVENVTEELERPFMPDWAVPPGAILTEIVEERNLDVRYVMFALGLSEADYQKLLVGDLRIDVPLAKLIAKMLGNDRWRYWLDLDVHYVLEKKRLELQKNRE